MKRVPSYRHSVLMLFMVPFLSFNSALPPAVPIAACTTPELRMNESDLWAEYAHLQQQADRRKLDAKAWAAEEQADEFLNAIASDSHSSSATAREAWLTNLATNRAKKHRRRAAFLRVHLHVVPQWAPSKAHQQAVLNETIGRVRDKTSEDEWSALYALATGEKYKAVADARGCSEAALKTRISRCRKRVHSVCA